VLPASGQKGGDGVPVELQLAYEAFGRAQAYSPECVQAWTGQALIAERIGSDESMDLFRHATELDYHVCMCVFAYV